MIVSLIRTFFFFYVLAYSQNKFILHGNISDWNRPIMLYY